MIPGVLYSAKYLIETEKFVQNVSEKKSFRLRIEHMALNFCVDPIVDVSIIYSKYWFTCLCLLNNCKFPRTRICASWVDVIG